MKNFNGITLIIACAAFLISASVATTRVISTPATPTSTFIKEDITVDVIETAKSYAKAGYIVKSFSYGTNGRSVVVMERYSY